MRIFKVKWVTRFARQEGIADAGLKAAIERAEHSLIDADLGGGLIKQRVARRGQGRSRGFRMLVAYRTHERAIFLYGFAKKERENIDPEDLLALRKIAVGWLAASAEHIDAALREGTLQEV